MTNDARTALCNVVLVFPQTEFEQIIYLFEHGNLQVSIPIKFRGIGSRHKIVYPGEVNEAPVIVALARAFRWQKYIDEGKFSNIRKLAKAVGLDESVVGATLRLRWLAPGLIHDILSGGCKDVSLKQLRHGVPELWREQVPGMVSSEVEA